MHNLTGVTKNIMAILDTFKKKKDAQSKKDRASEKPNSASSEKGAAAGSAADTQNALLRPHITEKAALLAENNAYVFRISPRANKADVAAAVRDIYGVTPEKIRIIVVPSKRVFVRGKSGVRSGYKKAMVYLKKGDSIEIV